MSVEELQDDDELFNSVADEVPDSPDAPEPPQDDESAPQERARDEHGRFAAKDAPDPEAPAVEKTADEDAHVPSWRVREINEEKRALAAELEALRAERQQWQQRQQQKPAEQAPAKAEMPDPLLDPQGYATAIREELRQEALNERREESLQRAAVAHPDEFKEAYQAAQRVVDPALKAMMQQSRDPGQTLLSWHREMKTRQEIGGDLNAYKQRLREEALKDPEFRKMAMDAWTQQASSTQANGRPAVRMPPSLSGMSRSNSLPKGQNFDQSDEELFDQTAG